MTFIPSPRQIFETFPIDESQSLQINIWRDTIASLVHGQDNRLLVIVGPCSIHDPKSAIEYAHIVSAWRKEFSDTLEIVMRTYWEKPRTTIGWKGLINDPYLDMSHDIAAGLRIARGLLCDILHIGVPTATEFLDPLSVPYIADLISWGAIGARTTESQIHRELASSLSCPVGFKNGTDGSIKVAIDAMKSAENSHTFLSCNFEGNIAIMNSSGNKNTHVILRGSSKGINFDSASILTASNSAKDGGLPYRIMIDVSHQNSQKDYRKQIEGIRAIVEHMDTSLREHILGVMIESSLIEGSQNFVPGKESKDAIEYGKSITDGCVGIDTTYQMLTMLHDSVAKRRD